VVLAWWGVEVGESLAQAAVREALEETGVEVALTHLVGLYSRPQWRDGLFHIALFAGQPVGGELIRATGETIDAGYFSLDALPTPLMWGHRVMVEDALSGKVGVVRAQNMVWPLADDLERHELYALRDRSGLSRQAFYLSLAPLIDDGDSLEIAGWSPSPYGRGPG
jgi:8-oxo-dGTP pyrophosphatase MutT (NUDIX family)